MPRPHANGSSGRAAASATPAAMPTEVSRAEETTAGRPHSPTTSRARRTPPSGATLTTMRSAASRWATSRGSSALRIDSSAATGTSTPLRANRTRSSRSSSTDRAGLLGILQPVCREGAQRIDRLVHVPGAVRVDADARLWPHRVADRRHPAHVVGQRLAALGDLDLRGPAAREPVQNRTDLLSRDGGHGRVDGNAGAEGLGPPTPGRLDRRRQPPGGLGRGVLEERRELAPPRRSLHERRLADRDAAEPDPHRNRDDPQAGQDGVEVGLRVVGRARAHRAIQPGLLRRRAPPSAAR